MKILKKFALLIFFVLLLFSGATQKTEAATSYSHAKDFYETCSNYDGQHIELYDGYLFYATYAKLATSEQNLKYTSLGFDITIYANGKSMVISVEKGGKYLKVIDSRNYKPNGAEYASNEIKASGSNYSLYKISYEDIKALALAKDKSLATQILKNDRITIVLDAIMTTKQYGKVHGSLAEDGKGNVKLSGSTYRLINNSDLQKLKTVFSTNGHTFESFYGIRQYMSNNTLTINYKLNGGTVANGYTSVDDMLYKSGKEYQTVKKHLEDVSVVNPTSVKLDKKGYHLEKGKEWTYSNKFFTPGEVYSPRDIFANIGKFSKTVTLEAKWVTNQYYIKYDANGGSGYMINSTFTYDVKGKLRNNGYSKQGYEFSGWNTEKDGTGKQYSNQNDILNETSENEKTIPLYAQWKPTIYTITADKMQGIGGTSKFYEWYGLGFSLRKDIFGDISTITAPKREGYDFLGYYTSILGMGSNVVNNTGKILMSNKFFKEDSTVYANWKNKEYTVYFDKQGGTGGTDRAKAYYGMEMPLADAPIRDGYTFMGYYTQPNGKGTIYYNDYMTSDKLYMIDGDLTLYAYWKDNVAPQVNLTANISIWTNRQIVLTANAMDFGSGLSSLVIYQGDTKVTEKTGLNGATQFTLAFDNKQEGAINYKAVATDMEGNTAEAFKTIYYDITAPQGEVLDFDYDANGNLTLDIFTNDYNIKN